jgi:hypothetical protein
MSVYNQLLCWRPQSASLLYNTQQDAGNKDYSLLSNLSSWDSFVNLRIYQWLRDKLIYCRIVQGCRSYNRSPLGMRTLYEWYPVVFLVAFAGCGRQGKLTSSQIKSIGCREPCFGCGYKNWQAPNSNMISVQGTQILGLDEVDLQKSQVFNYN